MIAATRRVFIAAVLLSAIWASGCSTKPKEPQETYTQRNQADSLMLRGHSLTDNLEYSQARSTYDTALSIYGSLDFAPGTVDALLSLGRNSRLTGDDAKAEGLYLHAQAIAENAEYNKGLQSALNHRADLALRRGDAVTAKDLLSDPVNDDEANEPLVNIGGERAAQLRLRGTAEYELGDENKALDLLEQAVSTAEEAGDRSEEAQAHYKTASIHSLAARFDQAADSALKALAADKAAEYAPGIAADLRALAIISQKSGDDAAAEDYYRRSWLAWRGLGRDLDADSALQALEDLSGRTVIVP